MPVSHSLFHKQWIALDKSMFFPSWIEYTEWYSQRHQQMYTAASDGEYRAPSVSNNYLPYLHPTPVLPTTSRRLALLGAELWIIQDKWYGHKFRWGLFCPELTREQSLALSRNLNGRLDFPGPTQEEAWIPHRNSRIPPKLVVREKNIANLIDILIR